MSKPALDFGDLDDYLSSDRSPENCMQLSDLDGFLHAIAVGPEAIPIEEWLSVVWGGERPKFRNTKEADHIIGVIKARYPARFWPASTGPLQWSARCSG